MVYSIARSLQVACQIESATGAAARGTMLYGVQEHTVKLRLLAK